VAQVVSRLLITDAGNGTGFSQSNSALFTATFHLASYSFIHPFITLVCLNNTHWMALYASRVSGLIPERFVCLCIHSYTHTFILHTYIHAYIRLHRELELLRRAVNSSAVCLLRRNHSVVRRTVGMGRLLHLCSNWAGQPDNPRHSAIKTGEITRKFLCLVKKWGHCPMACGEDQYLMTTHLDINFWLAKGVFRHFEDREVQEVTT